MDNKNCRAAAPHAANPGTHIVASEHHSRPTFRWKWQRVLFALVEGKTFNRFEAARELSDHCLHSTVAGLQERGITILRQDEVVPGRFGPVHCCRYRLSTSSLELARALLGLPRSRP